MGVAGPLTGVPGNRLDKEGFLVTGPGGDMVGEAGTDCTGVALLYGLKAVTATFSESCEK